jgi:diguanylate cyclase (GGDEF)-like protein
VILIDLDHFKGVNDTYGHLVGDRLLIAMAGAIKSVLREGDVVIRYGGEEFLVVLPAANSEDLYFVGERLRLAAAGTSLVEGKRTVRVTVSVGGACYPDRDLRNEEELVDLADRAMYRAKQAGRNRVEIDPAMDRPESVADDETSTATN